MALSESLVGKLSLPVVAAPMFLLSNPELVIETCRAGVLGSFPALNQRDSTGYEAWLIQINNGLQALQEQGQSVAPYAVNLIVHRTNPRLQADLELTVKHKVPVVITSLGTAVDVVDAVHSYGGLVYHDVTTIRFAEKALATGVDGVIAVCAGAGGHAGTYNPFAFISELRELTDKTILASGCISNGAGVLAAQAAGADLAYLGTRFIVAQESAASADYKQMVVDSSAKDIVHTPKISGVPASFLIPSLIAAGIDIDKIDTPEMNAAQEMNSEAKAWVDVWSAGQGVGGISAQTSVAQICTDLKAEYQDAHADLLQRQTLFRLLK